MYGIYEQITTLQYRCRLTIQRDEAIDHYLERNREYYAVASELLEEKEKNKKLTAQINRDFENSSIPSSLQKDGRKKYQTAVKEQAEDRAVRQATKDTVVKSMP